MRTSGARPTPVPGWVIAVGAVLLLLAGRFAIDAVLTQNTVDGPPARTSASPKVVSDYGTPHVIGRVRVEELTELSGLAASRRHPGLLWAHNDSGAGPYIYCLHMSGSPCGVYEIEGARAIDWEDISAAPGERDEDALYIADIGDNSRARSTVTIYRVAEPDVSGETRPASTDAPTGTLEADSFTMTYPDRAHDAEAIVVNRTTGDLYVITKEYSSWSEVFVARAPLADNTELEHLTSIKISGLLVDRTGAALAPSGDRIIFSTYDKGYEVLLPEGRPFDSIFNQTPIPVTLGTHEQGEAVTYTVSGDAIISASEGDHSPIYSVERRD